MSKPLDSSACTGCGHVILGSFGDHKTVREVGHGPSEVLCVECMLQKMPPRQPSARRMRAMGLDAGMY